MPWKVFYSYSHQDKHLRDKLATYLKPLVQLKKIVEWYDRQIEPGADWAGVISAEMQSANLILFLVSADFLASDYCFDVEVTTALERLKAGHAKVVPILLKPCLWEESRFSDLQIIPRGATPVTAMASLDDALTAVAQEIRALVAVPPPLVLEAPPVSNEPAFRSSLDLLREQVRSYAHLYERIRQRMPASWQRTQRMESVFVSMRSLATAIYPLLDELAQSPSPGERMAAVAILHVFASAAALPFLVRLIQQEQAFIQYQAIKALYFAVGAIDPLAYPQLLEAIETAKATMVVNGDNDKSDRVMLLAKAEQELRLTMEALSSPAPGYK